MPPASVEGEQLPVVTAEPPYSIFDKRQKWLIVIIVSTAATCKLSPKFSCFPLIPISLWFCLEHLLSGTPCNR